MRYTCELCGVKFSTLAELIHHFLREHRGLLPGWALAMYLEGRRLPLWRVYRELRMAGLARGVRA